MCGIAGLIHMQGAPVSLQVLRDMTETLGHRGPDGHGVFSDGPVGLGHRRLAILDLSAAGQQPMASEDGRLVITYNGEVYNFRELRRELEARGMRFRSKTDTEVVLRAYEAWGPACVERFNGMFAFAVWDQRERSVLLARDRYGIKPLYYAAWDQTLAFASEIKAILAVPGFPRAICYPALSEYFTFQNVLSDCTLMERVRLLPAGHTMRIRLGDARSEAPTRYWDYAFVQTDGGLTEPEAEEELFRLFQQAVHRQLVSDAPLGSYLSGGIDSASIAGIAARRVPHLPTFTCGFDLSSASGLELSFDERRTSEMLSHRFKTEQYEVVLKAGDMEAVMPELVWHLEDLRVGQCYPNYYIARLASKFVKVVLSGIGGDELFGGYPWRYYRAAQPAGRDAFHRGYYASWQRLVPDADRPAFFTPDTWRVVQAHQPFEAFRAVFGSAGDRAATPDDYVNLSLFFEAKTFLHGLFLVEDKLSMAHALETRVPFMDNDLVDFAMRIPVRLKLAQLDRTVRLDENESGSKTARYYARTKDGKQILRRTMERLVSKEVTDLAKQGFSAPDAAWFRGESIDYVRGMLTDRRARIYALINPMYVNRVLEEHCQGRVNRRLLIWSLLSLEWWLRRFLP